MFHNAPTKHFGDVGVSPLESQRNSATVPDYLGIVESVALAKVRGRAVGRDPLGGEHSNNIKKRFLQRNFTRIRERAGQMRNKRRPVDIHPLRASQSRQDRDFLRLIGRADAREDGKLGRAIRRIQSAKAR